MANKNTENKNEEELKSKVGSGRGRKKVQPETNDIFDALREYHKEFNLNKNPEDKIVQYNLVEGDNESTKMQSIKIRAKVLNEFYDLTKDLDIKEDAVLSLALYDFIKKFK